MNSIEKLLSISSEPLSHQAVSVSIPDFENYGSLGREIVNLLQKKNGFYAFESALHVFPAATSGNEMTLGQWNSLGLWRHEYGDLAEKKVFFAEDACGNQFCIHEDQINFFDSETGRVEVLARTLEQWAKRILAEYRELTSYPLMHFWQQQKGPISVGRRLLLRKPLVLGGDYSLTNVLATDAAEGMRLRGHIAAQIRNLPAGTQVDVRFTD